MFFEGFITLIVQTPAKDFRLLGISRHLSIRELKGEISERTGRSSNRWPTYLLSYADAL